VEPPDELRFRAVRSVVELPSKSPAPKEEEVEDWTREAEKSLRYG
jgi:hypothetical protein